MIFDEDLTISELEEQSRFSVVTEDYGDVTFDVDQGPKFTNVIRDGYVVLGLYSESPLSSDDLFDFEQDIASEVGSIGVEGKSYMPDHGMCHFLALEIPLEGDLVTGDLDGALSIAIGYAHIG